MAFHSLNVRIIYLEHKHKGLDFSIGNKFHSSSSKEICILIISFHAKHTTALNICLFYSQFCESGLQEGLVWKSGLCSIDSAAAGVGGSTSDMASSLICLCLSTVSTSVRLSPSLQVAAPASGFLHVTWAFHSMDVLSVVG